MKIYNATKYQLTIPISGSQNLTVPGHSASSNFLGTAYFVSMLITVKKPTDVAIIVGGPTEMALCASIPASAPYVVQSLDEAIQRFIPKDKPEEAPKVEEEKKEEPKPVAPAPKPVASDDIKVPIVKLSGVKPVVVTKEETVIISKTVEAPKETEKVEVEVEELSVPAEAIIEVVEETPAPAKPKRGRPKATKVEGATEKPAKTTKKRATKKA